MMIKNKNSHTVVSVAVSVLVGTILVVLVVALFLLSVGLITATRREMATKTNCHVTFTDHT